MSGGVIGDQGGASVETHQTDRQPGRGCDLARCESAATQSAALQDAGLTVKK